MTQSHHLDLIAQILAKAERTNHPEEAEMLFARAQKLSTRYSIDLAMARAHTEDKETREQVEEQTVRIGKRGQKGLSKFTRLFIDIAAVNGIKCLISQDSTTVYAHGFPSDIDLAQTLYSSIVVQMVQAGNAYIASGEYKDEKVWVDATWKKTYTGETSYWGGREYNEEYVPAHYKSVHGTTARVNFYAGFTTRILQRLRAAQAATEAEMQQEEDARNIEADVAPERAPIVEQANLPVSMSLVLAEKKAEVEEFYNAKIKAQNIRGSWGGERRSSRNSTHVSGARTAGVRAANNVSLSSHKSIGA